MEKNCPSLNNWKERIGKFKQGSLKIIGKLSDILKAEDQFLIFYNKTNKQHE
jgi:hypothetical protein